MIYYIYKVRRKQTSIRSSRSALPHRYLRSISWISWKGISPLQAGFLSVLHPVSHLVRPPTTKARIQLCPLLLLSPSRRERKYLLIFFSRKRKLPFFPFSRASRVSFLYLPPLARAARDPSAAGPSPAVYVAFCGPPINKKCGPTALRREPAHHKKCRLLAQENTRRHAWLSRSCFGRKNLFIDGPHSLLLFFLSPFLQRKRKKKTEANSAGSNTSLGLTSFVLTMYAIGPSRLVR